ncbi:reverse transcriptase domain-containing protein [Streptomyces sp. M19]
MLRRDRPHGSLGAGARPRRRQARSGAGEGVPEGWHPLRGPDSQAHRHRHPQGGILSPLLANIALSVLDEFFAEEWKAAGSNSTARTRHRRRGGATYRLVRYADDFVVMVAGTKTHAEAIREKVTGCSFRWACACRRRRRASSISTRASPFWVSASSGNGRREAASGTSTPGRPTRH